MKYGTVALVVGFIILLMFLPAEPTYAGSKKGKNPHGAESGITPKDSAELEALIEQLQKELGENTDTPRKGFEEDTQHGIVTRNPMKKIDYLRLYGPRAVRRG